MRFRRLMTSVCALALMTPMALAVAPTGAQAQSLRVQGGAVRDSLNVAMNRAVVVESDVPFVELSIANPGIADISTLSDRSIYVLGKAPGRTTLTILGEGGQLIANVEVQVAPDIAEFRERLRQILPSEPIEVRTANDGIVMSGTVSSITRLDAALQLAERYAPGRISNLMTVGGTQQVMLRVRFSEVQRGAARNLSAGVRVQGSGGDLQLGSRIQRNADGVVPGVLPEATAGGFGSFRAGGLQFQVLIEALESQGLARTLSEPSLTTLSGQEASFLAGGELPVPVVDEGGRASVDYRPFGVQLSFTPRVLDGGVINLVLNASVSSVDQSTTVSTGGGVSVPAFRTRQAATTVELRDGESFVVAGLLQDDFQGGSRRVPWLADIPVLGALFRSTDFQRNQSELMIFVTAHLVTPTRGEALMMPTDRIRLPTERELFLQGRLQGGAAEVSRQDFRGSFGYVMD